MIHLTRNFSLSEMIKSDTAVRHGIANRPNPEQHQALVALCQCVLQPCADRFGAIRVTSGFRSQELNALIGGSDTSQHSKGEAADIECYGMTSNLELARWIAANLKFDQVILEFYDGSDPKSGWVHVSYRRDGKNRGEMLWARKQNGKTIYNPVDLKTFKGV